MRRHLYHENSAGFCIFVFIQFVYIGAYAHVPVYVTFKLPDAVQTLLGPDNFVGISIMHAYDDATAAFIAEGCDISKDTAATFLWLVFACAVIGHIAMFAFLELHVIFRFTHLFELFDCIFKHIRGLI